MASSFTQKIKSFFTLGSAIDSDFFDELCDLLIEGDFGAALAFKTIEDLQSLCKKEHITTAEKIKETLFSMLKEMLSTKDISLFSDDKLNVLLLLGVNGVGKTTSAAKLASLCSKNGRVIMAAADTFRAAAIDQLKIHGERLCVRVVAHKDGGDPAAVVYDALDAAIAGDYNFVVCDSAGRMHTKSSLVEELKKIDRVVLSKSQNINYKKILVLDATTGTNALAQAEVFSNAVNVDAVILTKADSDAKGGAAFSLAADLKLPIGYVCTGEKYEDIAPFNASSYVRKFLGYSD
ncbi:MAG: signal recognition particle-docking protein FtsY [Termitinemataceae bacterium]|nr:MAG: signal recognition particle-docking protein FtsY [Termitinemataceae bacterium]